MYYGTIDWYGKTIEVRVTEYMGIPQEDGNNAGKRLATVQALTGRPFRWMAPRSHRAAGGPPVIQSDTITLYLDDVNWLPDVDGYREAERLAEELAPVFAGQLLTALHNEPHAPECPAAHDDDAPEWELPCTCGKRK